MSIFEFFNFGCWFFQFQHLIFGMSHGIETFITRHFIHVYPPINKSNLSISMWLCSTHISLTTQKISMKFGMHLLGLICERTVEKIFKKLHRKKVTAWQPISYQYIEITLCIKQERITLCIRRKKLLSVLNNQSFIA